MKDGKLMGCVKTVDFMRSGRWSKAATQAKGLNVSLRTESSYRKAIREARKLRFESQDQGPKTKIEGPRSRSQGAPSSRKRKGDRVRGRETRAQPRTPADDHRKYLSRLVHCDWILELEYSGWRGDVQELAKIIGADKRTIFRELRLIEEVTGRPVKLVQRRRKRTNR